MKHFLNTDVEITIEEVMPRSPSPPLEEKLTTIVHRVKVLEELIEMFKNHRSLKSPFSFHSLMRQVQINLVFHEMFTLLFYISSQG